MPPPVPVPAQVAWPSPLAVSLGSLVTAPSVGIVAGCVVGLIAFAIVKKTRVSMAIVPVASAAAGFAAYKVFGSIRLN